MATTVIKPSTQKDITLKGSCEVVTEYLFYAVNSILHQRCIYPPDSFRQVKQYGMQLFVTDANGVKDYLTTVGNQIKGWMLSGAVERISLEIRSVTTKEVVERWQFKINSEDTSAANGENKPPQSQVSKDEETIRKGIRAVMLQIISSITVLPLIDEKCSFDLLVHFKPGAQVPKQEAADWEDKALGTISNARLLPFQSFSTGFHSVESSVAYKQS